MDATALLRPHLLDGRVVALGGGGDGGDGATLLRPLATLGAATPQLPAVADEEAMAAAVDPGTHALVHDLRSAFGASEGDDALRTALDLAWITVRAVANAAFIPAARGGKVVVIAPRPDDARPAAAGVRAAAENLARTLSIEWARHAITSVAITPGADSDDFQLAALAAYLVSPAGDYFSGCRLALGEVALTA
jgi:NAD(P)-dependent dehydrogenase (short-subunit alcohol dehydrogenase family)